MDPAKKDYWANRAENAKWRCGRGSNGIALIQSNIRKPEPNNRILGLAECRWCVGNMFRMVHTDVVGPLTDMPQNQGQQIDLKKIQLRKCRKSGALPLLFPA